MLSWALTDWVTLAKSYHLFEPQVIHVYHGGFIHPFNKYLLSIYYMPGTVLCSGDITVNKTDKNPCPRGDDILEDNSHTLLIQMLSGLNEKIGVGA